MRATKSDLAKLRTLLNRAHRASVARRRANRETASPLLLQRRELASSLRSAIESCRWHAAHLVKSIEDRAIDYVSRHSMSYPERLKTVEAAYETAYETAAARRAALIAFDEEHGLTRSVAELPLRLDEAAVTAAAKADWTNKLAAMRAQLRHNLYPTAYRAEFDEPIL